MPKTASLFPDLRSTLPELRPLPSRSSSPCKRGWLVSHPLRPGTVVPPSAFASTMSVVCAHPLPAVMTCRCTPPRFCLQVATLCELLRAPPLHAGWSSLRRNSRDSVPVVTVDFFDLAHDDVPLLASPSRSLRPPTPSSLVSLHVGFTKDVAIFREYMLDPRGTTGVMDQEGMSFRRPESSGACRIAS